jgi:hypothetical protein
MAAGQGQRCGQAMTPWPPMPPRPSPLRDLATVRQVALFDTLKPEDIITRLKPLAVPGNAVVRPGGRAAGAGLSQAGQ